MASYCSWLHTPVKFTFGFTIYCFWTTASNLSFFWTLCASIISNIHVYTCTCTNSLTLVCLFGSVFQERFFFSVQVCVAALHGRARRAEGRCTCIYTYCTYIHIVYNYCREGAGVLYCSIPEDHYLKSSDWPTMNMCTSLPYV